MEPGTYELVRHPSPYFGLEHINIGDRFILKDDFLGGKDCVLKLINPKGRVEYIERRSFKMFFRKVDNRGDI
jgi:hypothetical protein